MKIAVFETKEQVEAYEKLYRAVEALEEAFNIEEGGQLLHDLMQVVKEAIDNA